jgi:hypothetical protein
MPFVPGLSLFPTSTIRGAILKQIGNILVQSRLIVLGDKDVVPSTSLDASTEITLRMHGIQGKDASFDQLRGQQRLERADLILFLCHIAMPEHDASGHLITTELMHRLRLGRGGTQRFAIDGQVGVIRLSLRRL